MSMKWRYATFAGGLFTGASLVIALGGLRGTPGSSRSAALGSAKVLAADSLQVELKGELATRAKLKTEKLKQEVLSPILRLVGSVSFDANERAEVGARIDGRISRLLVEVGDVVKRGQPLVEIESSALGEVLAELLGARANLIAAENNEKRENLLHAQQLASAPVVERARAEVKALTARVHGAEQRLLTMGLSKDEIGQLTAGKGSGRITLRSPLDGEIIERFAVLGQVVGPTEPVLSVANLDHLWVELDVFEHDLARVSDGNKVVIESDAHAGKTFAGTVTHIDAQLNVATRTARVRIEVDNRERLLRPGQFVTARLTTAGVARAALTVPELSVLQVEGQPAVFVAIDHGKYVARPVELGAVAGDRVEVTRGLVEGESIVTDGAFVLKSELLR
jgi:cobalt-zinc-cadmium efflux system membrane fusion protein